MAAHEVARLDLALDGCFLLAAGHAVGAAGVELQPLGGLAGEGMEPSSTMRFIFTFGSGMGMAEKSAFV